MNAKKITAERKRLLKKAQAHIATPNELKRLKLLERKLNSYAHSRAWSWEY